MFFKFWKKDKNKDSDRRVETEKSTLSTYSQRYAMKKLLTEAFAGYPEAMSLTQLAKITGYTKKQIRSWSSSHFLGRRVTVVKRDGEEFVSVSALIDFFASNYGFGIPDRRKTKWHKELIKTLEKKK